MELRALAGGIQAGKAKVEFKTREQTNNELMHPWDERYPLYPGEKLVLERERQVAEQRKKDTEEKMR